MADNNFRAHRGRDPLVRDDDDASGRDAAYNPLAELARLIGQADPVPDYGRGTRHDPRDTFAELAPASPAAPDMQWAAEADYAEPAAHEEDHYRQPREDDRYVQPRDEDDYVAPRLAEPDLPGGDYAAYDQDDQIVPPPRDRYLDQPQSSSDAGDEEPRYDARYRDQVPPPRTAGRQLPSLAPQSDDDYAEEDDEQWPDRADGRSDFAQGSDFAQEYADDDPPRPLPRRGIIVMAVVGLVLFGGAASVFAYRAVYGGAILPTLPPIIKAGDGPIKINPAHGDAQADPSSRPGVGSGDSGVKLMTRQEQPVDVPPPNAAPRVVQTIPVIPGTASGAPVVASQSAPGAISPPPTGASPFPPPPAASSFPPPAALPSVVPPAPAAAPPAQAATPPSTEPKKVHTLSIRPDAVGSAHVATAGPLPPARISNPSQPQPAARPGPAADTRTGTGAPLSLVPTAPGDARASEPAPPRQQMARTEPRSAPLATTPTPVSAPAAASTGGYAVQVTSQRSEAEAQAAFRSLRAKYPGQLGSRAPIIRRAELGDKGTFYRALVGPFGSREEAAQVCTSLKAAGGTCLIQGI